MENPEEVLHSLEEFTKFKPKDIPRELEEYLSFVAKTGDPVYQWPTIKSLFREKLISVVTEFYETCPSVEIPPCPNVDLFNYDTMKTFILEKLETFASAPFTIQRICELLTTPRKEYNRIDKYMRALEKNIVVVTTVEPGRRAENGDGVVNGIETEHMQESNSNNEINVEEMDDSPSWPKEMQYKVDFPAADETSLDSTVQETFVTESKISETELACSSSEDTMVTCQTTEQEPYVSIEPVPSNSCVHQESVEATEVAVTITPVPAGVQNRRNSVEPVVSTDSTTPEVEVTESSMLSSDDTQEVPSETNPEPKLEQTEPPDSPKTVDSTTVSQTFSDESNTSSSATSSSSLVSEKEFETVIEEENSTTTEEDSVTTLTDDDASPVSAFEIVIPEPSISVPDTAEVDSDITEESNVSNNEAATKDESPLADTTKDSDEVKSPENFVPIVEEDEIGKDEEISSSDKVEIIETASLPEEPVIGDEAEAKEVEVEEEEPVRKEEKTDETEVVENETVVSASTDDISTCETSSMDVDVSIEKDDMNEAEASCD